jgi:type IV secretion system protein TrbB
MNHSTRAPIDPFISALETYLPDLSGFLADPAVSEIYVNPGSGLFIDRVFAGREETGIAIDPSRLRAFLNAVATFSGSVVNDDAPELAAQLPLGEPFYGARLQGFIPPLTTSPAVVIRKHSREHFTLEDLLSRGTVTAAQADRLREALDRRQNILIAGGTSSGKTTLLDALLSELPAAERVVTIEDTRELKSPTRDWLSLTTSPSHSTLHLLASTLRSHPDRIVLGELRDQAAYAFLEALSTGHPGGATTIHASSAASALSRLARLAALAIASETGVSFDAVTRLVEETVDLVVVLAATPRGRRVIELSHLNRSSAFQLVQEIS